MRAAPIAMVAVLLPATSLAALAAPDEPARPGGLQLDAALTARRFEQQVKSKVGDPAGERLVEEFEVGLALQAAWRFEALPWLAAGVYAHTERGVREAARFKEFADDDKATVTEGQLGGAYTELWLGPYVRLDWRWLFAELGYGAVGIRWDDGRDDLPDEDGGVDEPLRTDPGIAYLAQLGGRVELTPCWDVFARVRYRVRYYDRRGSAGLPGTMEHGTQDFTPFIGVAYRLGGAPQ